MPTLPKPEPSRAPGRKHRVLNPVATPRIRGRKLQARNAFLYRRNPLCVRCLERGKFTEVEEWHHPQRLADGGRDHPSNLEGLCRECHRATHGPGGTS